jgi:K+:H+ antiporter subunit KhtU
MELLIVEGGLACALMTIARLVATKLRLSLVPLLLAAGMAVGPHIPSIGMIDWRFAHSASLLAFMGRLGAVCLVFALGLEWTVGCRPAERHAIVLGISFYIAMQDTLALAYANVMGWPWQEGFLVAGMMTISSRAIAINMRAQRQCTNDLEAAMLHGIPRYEAVFGTLYLTGVAALILGGTTPFQGMMSVVGVAVGGMLGGCRLRRHAVVWLNRTLHLPADPTFLCVLFAGWCVVAGVSETLHLAEIFGMLLIGCVLATTEHRQRIARLIRPCRDFLGAFFCFYFGLTIDPFALQGAVGPALGAVGLTLAGTLLAGRLAGRAAGLASGASYTLGLTFIARGELSLILAYLGAAGGLLPVLQPFAALYVLALALIGPLLAKESARISTALQGLKW